jgi:hypothetical protein
VTLTGSGFGTSQGSGTVWLGTTLGSVLSWSNTQVVATVNTGSSSGVAQIQQNNRSSNVFPFTVNTATITQISPNSGLPGTQVTITGSGFGATQANGMVSLGTAAAVVDSWSDGQVVATVANGSNTGNAQILQNGVWSNSIPFSIDGLQVANISPNSGSAGTVVTITGGGFGIGQGNGNVWIGNTYGVVMGWSDTQIVASVASSAVSGVVRVEQNGVWSNALAFSVPSGFGGGTQFSIVPSVISMVIGDTRSIQAIDSNGQEVTGLSWSSSNTAVITLSTDDPPILTAVGAGTATINTGSASADVTVYAGPTLPIGTKIWSNSGDGSGVTKIIPAVPSASGGADVFALQNSGVVMALRSDGTHMWSANVGVGATLIPDFQGGLVVAGTSNQRLDGQTGQPTAQLSGNPVLVHTDGTIFLDGAISGVNAATGNQKFPPIQTEQGSSWVYDGGNCGEYSPIIRQGPYSTLQPGPGIGQPIIAGDGYAYFPYIWGNTTGFTNVCDNGEPSSSLHTDFHLRILRVGTDGSSQEITIGDWSMDSAGVNGVGRSTGGIPNVAGSLITNADQGALYSWGACIANPNTGQCTPQYSLTTIAQDGTPTTVPSNLGATNSQISPYALSPVQPVLQRADNSYIGTATTSTGSSMLAFTASGQRLWSQPNYTPQIATSGGGVIATSQSGQAVTFDGIGNQTGQLPSLPTQSWSGKAYQDGALTNVASTIINLAASFWAFQGSNQSDNSTAAQQTEYPQLVSCYASDNPNPPPCPGPRQIIWNAYKALAISSPLSGAPAVLVTNASFIQTNLFTNLNGPNGSVYREPAFVSYLQQGFAPYDGTTSTAPLTVLGASSLLTNKQVKSNFLTGSGQPDPDAYASTMGGQTPLTVFFNPYNFDKSGEGVNLENMALLFHEGLHGFTNMTDVQLQNAFGCQTKSQLDSLNITDYLRQFLVIPPNPRIAPCD